MPEMSTRALERALAALLGVYALGSVAALPFLPERMPRHFDFAGRVTAWTEQPEVLWLLLPALAIGLIALVRAAAGPPEAWQIPREDVKRFKALSPEDQLEIRNLVRRQLATTLLVVTFIFIAVQIEVYATARTGAERAHPLFYLALAGGFGAIVYLGRRSRSALTGAIRSAADAPAGDRHLSQTRSTEA